MANYMIRIVLHGAEGKHYDILHEEMQSIGAKRAIQSDDGTWFDLPDAEYVLESAVDLTSVRDASYAAARAAKPAPDPSVLVTRWDAAAWWMKPVPGDS